MYVAEAVQLYKHILTKQEDERVLQRRVLVLSLVIRQRHAAHRIAQVLEWSRQGVCQMADTVTRMLSRNNTEALFLTMCMEHLAKKLNESVLITDFYHKAKPIEITMEKKDVTN